MCCDVVVCVLVQFAGVMVALLMLVLPKVIFYLPSAVLSSMIMVAVGGLIDYKTAMRLWHQDRPDFLVGIVDRTLGLEPLAKLRVAQWMTRAIIS